MEKARVCVSARLVWGIGEERTVWLSARGAPSDDWDNGGYVDDLLVTCGECGLRSLGSWSVGMDVELKGKTCVEGWHSRNLILGIYGCRIAILTIYLWPSGDRFQKWRF